MTSPTPSDRRRRAVPVLRQPREVPAVRHHDEREGGGRRRASAPSSTTSSPRPRRCACSTPGPATGRAQPTCCAICTAGMPTVPFVVVGKEVSMEDTRLTLSTLPDRFSEHPETVVVLTNMFYAEAPELFPRNPDGAGQGPVVGRPARGQRPRTSSSSRSVSLENVLAEGWQTVTSPKTGNPVYAKPSVLVLYRSDRAFALDDLIPRNIGAAAGLQVRPRARRPAVPIAHRRPSPRCKHGAGADRPRAGPERTAGRRAVDRSRPGHGDRAAHLAGRRTVRDPAAHADQGARPPAQRRDGPPTYRFEHARATPRRCSPTTCTRCRTRSPTG